MTREYGYGPSELHAELGPNNEGLVQVAQEVAIDRGRCVASTLFHMSAVRTLQAPDASNALVRCQRAAVQSSRAQDGQQAAHLLPGQIVVNNEPVWQLARSTNPSVTSSDLVRLEQQTKLCFAATNVLPAFFNRADTEAEGTGEIAAAQTLKPLFGTLTQQLWREARVDPARPLVIDREVTIETLRAWFRNISNVYADAAHRKAGRGRTEEARVLETYSDSFRVANPSRFVIAELPALYQRYRFLR